MSLSSNQATKNYLISSLSCEIDAIIPIRRSYADLQNYHLKISSQLQGMLHDHGAISEHTTGKLKQQNIILGHLGQEREFLLKKLKELENSQAELKMEKKNLLGKSQSFALNQNLERQQNYIRRSQQQQAQENLHKISANVENMQRTLQNLENSIKQKNEKRMRLDDQIKRRQNFNQRIQNNANALEKNLQKLSFQNQDKANKNQALELEINDLNNQIERQERKKLSLHQQIIQKTQTLNRFKNQKEYYLEKLQNQLNSNHIILSNEERLNNILANRRRELDITNNDINETKGLIQQQNEKYKQAQRSIKSSQAYMVELMETNSLMIQKMEEWCLQDLQIMKVIESKSKKLRLTVNKTRNVLGERQFNVVKTGKSFNNTKSTQWRQLQKQN